MADAQTYERGTPIREVGRRERWAVLQSLRWPGWKVVALNAAAFTFAAALALAVHGVGEMIWRLLTWPIRLLVGG
jgi:hypothetical protein